MDSRSARITVAIIAALVLAGFVWWSFARGGDPPDLASSATTTSVITSAEGDEDAAADNSLDDAVVEVDPGDPPPQQETTQRWPMVSDAAVASADQSIELTAPGGGRVLVLVDCDSVAFGMGIGVAAVGLPPDTDVVALTSPELDPAPGLMTDPSGNGFRAVTVPLPAASYRLTFPALDNLSTTVTGCPDQEFPPSPDPT